MVEIINEILMKKATMIAVPKGRPEIAGLPGDERIVYSGLEVPAALNKQFLKKCGIDIIFGYGGLSREEAEERIFASNEKKDLFLRLAGKKPLSVVTSKFKEINPYDLMENASRMVGSEPVIRYFKNNESLQMNFPLQTNFKGMHLVLNTGSYGTYGGSGKNAASYGLTWFNLVCANWTMFLNKFLGQGMEKIIHLQGKDSADGLERVLETARGLGSKIDESHEKQFSYEDLDRYFGHYEKKGLNKKISDQIKEENKHGMSAFDLSYRLTQLCQDNALSDTSRARVEYLAGEVILCYDQIKKGITNEWQHMQRFNNRGTIPSDRSFATEGLEKSYALASEKN
jgi:hypothetical protein